MSDAFERAMGALAADARLWSDFEALCDCGGRVAGSESERRGLALVERLLGNAGGGEASSETVPYAGWQGRGASLEIVRPRGVVVPLVANPLVGAQPTPAAGVTGEVIDLGRGTPEQFAQSRADIAGRIVLVSHEYPFAAGHIHRRRKYNAAMEAGATGFIISNPVPGIGPTCGSSGRGGGAGIPAIATDFESGALLRAGGGMRPIARMRLAGEDAPATTQVIMLDIPGRGPERVVLSAHVDGHDLAESAMDNATGVVVAIAIARAFAPHVAALPRGLRVCLFSAEEWALAGSKAYLDAMDAAARRRLVLNVNLDTVAGGSRLTALTSEFPALDTFVQDATRSVGLPIGTYRPLMQNSDHYNFAQHGIPALRLVTGFDDAGSNVRYILTPADTRDKVAPAELKSAAIAAAAIVWRGLTAGDDALAALARR
jgi:hypothetical protein